MEIFPYKISTVTPRPCTLAGPTSEHDRHVCHVERIRTQLLHRSVVLECVDSTMRDFGPPQPSVRQERAPGRLLHDLIFMDCNMPVMDGYEACNYIRKQEARLGLVPIPIIALTAYAMPGDRDKCLEHGMTDYLTKPMTKQALMQVVARARRLLNPSPFTLHPEL